MIRPYFRPSTRGLVTIFVCVTFTSDQAKRIAYFLLKNDVGPKNMRQNSLLVVLTYLFYVIFALESVVTVYFVHSQLERASRFWQL